MKDLRARSRNIHPSDSYVLADARWSGPHGIGRYAHEVLPRLSDKNLHLDELEGLTPLHPLEPLWLSWKIARSKPGVYYSPGFNPPLWSATPFVFTIHDLIHLRYPGDYGWKQRAYYERVVKPATRRASAVLTVSEFSQREIVEWAGIPESKVVITGAGVGSEYSPAAEPLRIPYRYLLYVGNRKPHKNLPRLLRAFAKVSPGREERLLLSGGEDHETTSMVRRLGLEGRVSFYGPVADKELPRLYRGAVALVLPSLMEGFGLPVLEAMACGTPVVASKAGAIPEVAGKAALMFDPLGEEALAGALRRVLDDGKLRLGMSERGLQRAALFSWDAVADTVYGVLCEAAGQKVRP